MKRMLLVAASSIALLSGCAHSPGTAATVAGHEISTHDLDVLTNALCLEQVQSGQAQPTTTASLRESALSALISSKVDADYAAKHDLTYPPLALSRQLSQLDDLIDKLPDQDQKLARTLIKDLLRGQLQLQQVAVAEVQQSGQKPTAKTITAAIQEIESEHAKTLKTVVNPRYDTGTTKDADGASVSKAVSTTAKTALDVLRGKATEASNAYVAALPANQRCS